MDKLVAALEKSLGDDIKTLPWMSETRRKRPKRSWRCSQQDRLPGKVAQLCGTEGRAQDLIGNVERSTVFEREWDLDHWVSRWTRRNGV